MNTDPLARATLAQVMKERDEARAALRTICGMSVLASSEMWKAPAIRALRGASEELNCIIVRCPECLDIEQHNANATEGAECGGCITKERDQLRAQLAASEADRWKPIATAPKDGTLVIVTNDEAKGSWVASYKPVYLSGFRPPNPWHSMMLNHKYLPNQRASTIPTHWQPLPQPPQ